MSNIANMKNTIYLFLFVFYSTTCFAFDGLLFNNLTANPLESRIGAINESGEKLRLDIGHSLDLLSIYTDDNVTWRAGGDFFILSRLRSEGHFKFPVETADYFFGLNTASKFHNYNISARLRIAHISSHLIDGYSANSIFWKAPFVYSREFVDLVVKHDNIISNNVFLIQPYIGACYIFSTIPKDVTKFIPQFGVDFEADIIPSLSIKGGYDLKLYGCDNSVPIIGNNATQCGLKYKFANNIGISLNYYYFSGYSIHGMFYNEKERYHGLGVQVEY